MRKRKQIAPLTGASTPLASYCGWLKIKYYSVLDDAKPLENFRRQENWRRLVAIRYDVQNEVENK